MGMGNDTGKVGGIRGKDDDLSRLGHQAQAIERLSGKWCEPLTTQHVHLLSIAIYPPKTGRNGSWLLVAKGWYDGQRLVAFVRSTSIVSALASMLTQWAQAKLRWKVDDYADKPFLKGR